MKARNIVELPPSWFNRVERLAKRPQYGLKQMLLTEEVRLSACLRNVAETRLKIQHLKNKLKEEKSL